MSLRIIHTADAHLGARLLTSGCMPPLVFDDAFSHFDDYRLDRLEDLLVDAARGWQIILLTCTHRYDSLAERGANIIELGPA